MSGTREMFDDIPARIERLESEIQARRARAASQLRKDRWGLMWIWGAEKHQRFLMAALEAQRRGEHRCMIHEIEDGVSYSMCCCGARFQGRMHEDFTLEDFANLPGHRDMPLTQPDR